MPGGDPLDVRIRVDAGVADASRCAITVVGAADGDGKAAARPAGTQFSTVRLHVDAFDAFGNALLRGGADVRVDVARSSWRGDGDAADVELHDLNNGQYEARFVPLEAGEYRVAGRHT